MKKRSPFFICRIISSHPIIESISLHLERCRSFEYLKTRTRGRKCSLGLQRMIFPSQLDSFLSSTGENLPRLIQRLELLLFSVVHILGIVFVELQIPAKKASFLFPFFSRSVQNLCQRTPPRNLTSHRALLLSE